MLVKSISELNKIVKIEILNPYYINYSQYFMSVW